MLRAKFAIDNAYIEQFNYYVFITTIIEGEPNEKRLPCSALIVFDTYNYSRRWNFSSNKNRDRKSKTIFIHIARRVSTIHCTAA